MMIIISWIIQQLIWIKENKKAGEHLHAVSAGLFLYEKWGRVAS